MKLPQGSAAYGIPSSRPTISPQKPPVQNQTNAAPPSAADDAARVALGSIPASASRTYSSIPSQAPTSSANRQSAIGAYARSSAQSNPFAETVASFSAKPETSKTPATTQAKPPTDVPPAATIFSGEAAPRTSSAQTASTFKAAGTTSQSPSTSVARPTASDIQSEVDSVDDDDETIVTNQIDPQLEALAVRYVENYARQTNKPLSGEERQKKIAEVARFYGAPSRSGRLEALVKTQDEVG